MKKLYDLIQKTWKLFTIKGHIHQAILCRSDGEVNADW